MFGFREPIHNTLNQEDGMKLISLFLLFTVLTGIVGCESHHNDAIQQEEEKPVKQVHPEGNQPGTRG
jgi:hypothetical protein